MRDRLIELINRKQDSGWKFVGEGEEYTTDVFNFELADHLLANGVIVQAKGHWIETQREWDFDPFYYIDYQCSVCGMREQDKSPFCRWCGTQMKEERSNENAE